MKQMIDEYYPENDKSKWEPVRNDSLIVCRNCKHSFYKYLKSGYPLSQDQCPKCKRMGVLKQK